jgi:hypothetical protein
MDVFDYLNFRQQDVPDKVVSTVQSMVRQENRAFNHTKGMGHVTISCEA